MARHTRIAETDLRRLYLDEGKTDSDIGRLYGVSREAVRQMRNKFGIETLSPWRNKEPVRPCEAIIYRKPPTIKRDPTPTEQPAIDADCIYIPLTQGKVAIVGPEDEEMAHYRWHVQGGYAARLVFASSGKQRARMHRVILERILGRPLRDTEMPDHVNGNKLDNRRCNLRLATRSLNKANHPLQRNNRSGYKGVWWNIKAQRWMSNITANKQHYYLGLFDTPEDAARAYDRAAREHFGEFAWLNFPDETL